jgi:hypothetical protein
MIYSYETLLNSWIESKNPEKLHMIGETLKNDSENFLLDDAVYLLTKAAKTGDAMTFIAMLFSYDIDDLSEIELTLDDKLSEFDEMFLMYKNSAIDKLQKKALSLIDRERRYSFA